MNTGATEHMSEIRKFIEWLSYHPTTEEIARALATEYLAEFAVLGIRFGRINTDDSITVFGQYGYPDADKYRERNVPSAEWRAIDADDVRIIKGEIKAKWTPDSTMHVNSLRDRGVIQGLFNCPFPQSGQRLGQAQCGRSHR
jgi:hypothetical protein